MNTEAGKLLEVETTSSRRDVVKSSKLGLRRQPVLKKLAALITVAEKYGSGRSSYRGGKVVGISGTSLKLGIEGVLQMKRQGEVLKGNDCRKKTSFARYMVAMHQHDGACRHVLQIPCDIFK